MLHAVELTVTPLARGQKSNVNFGASITGVDMNNLDEATFQQLREAIYVNSVVVVKNQHHLLPTKQFEFIKRLDPDAPAKHGFGTLEETKATVGVLGNKDWLSVPGTTAVQLVGHGCQGDDHYGLQGLTIAKTGHRDFHEVQLPKEELDKGQTRFSYFHYDGIVYGNHPSMVTSLRCLKAPAGPDVTVRWDDGTERTMKAQAGCTAFISCAQLYSLLTDEEKKLAENSYWEPVPHPFVWVGTGKFRN
ncbi:Fc.00g108350.m01.CDS01 [Cosmosporella sp. VM-42]